MSLSRFARDLVAQELGLLLLIKRGVRVLTANGDDLTDTSDPSRVMMRQIAGSFAQYEKTRLVTKLRGARERVREVKGKCEGRKSYAERSPELVLAAKRLHRRSPKGHRRSLRQMKNRFASAPDLIVVCLYSCTGQLLLGSTQSASTLTCRTVPGRNGFENGRGRPGKLRTNSV
jgi:DNA invertase Pin-like site-specific DNA recombinase